VKIGLVIYGSLDTVSGGYLYDRKLVESLQRSGDMVEIFSLPWRNYGRHLADNFSNSILKQAVNKKLDILLEDELNHPSLFKINQKIRSAIQVPIVTIVHHLRSSEQRPAWQNRLYARIEKLYLQSVDGFIFNSQTTRQCGQILLQKKGDELLPHVIAYPAGDRFSPQINTELIRERSKEPGSFRLVFLGNIIRRKGLHTLLQAIHLFQGADIKLDIVGSLLSEPGYAAKMQKLVKRSGLDQSVKFWGAVDDRTLARILISSQVLVVPSSYEGYGIAYLEGMSFGLPAIATTHGAAWEIITPGQDGMLVQPDQPEQLAETLSYLAKDRSRLSEMSLAARQRFLNHPTWEQSTERIRNFLKNWNTG
jgi:glycosyltransferase involved in cell wall biosynthesis